MIKYFSLFLLITFLALGVVKGQDKDFNRERWSPILVGEKRNSDFVILVSGEKIFGKIIRNYDRTNYDEVVIDTEGSQRTYLPKDLEGFGLSKGQLFFSKALPGTEEPVFLQVLVSGKLVLTKYRDRYFLDNGKDYEELKVRYEFDRDDKTAYKRIAKPYMATLKYFLSGDCGVKLFSEIDKLPFVDFALIRIVEEYLDCPNGSNDYYLDKIPFFLISPVAGLGVSHFSINPIQISEERADQLGPQIGYGGFAGVRFHDFRVLPRFSTELRLAYSYFNTEIFSSYNGSQVIWTGSEQLKETSVYIPWSFQYSLLKNQQMDFFVGFLAGMWFGDITQNGGMVDERILSRNEVFISESPIHEPIDSKFITGFKAGTNLKLNRGTRLFAELEWTVQNLYYQFELFQNDSEYSRNRFAIQFGIEF